MRGLRALGVFALAAGASAVAHGAGGELRAGAGADYSTGTYGQSTSTEILSIPFMARYETDRWTFKLSIPYLRVTGPGNVIPGVGRHDRPPRAAGTTTESGLGDTVGSATYTVYYDDAAKRGLDLTGKVKLPTADADRGLGTGSTDESVQVDLYQTQGLFTVFADIGYTFFGHSDVVQLENAPYYGLGFSEKLDAANSLGASFDGRERVTPGGAPRRELTAFWNRRMDRATRLQAYVLKGFADGSPDWGIGASLMRGF
ncbi:MAG TPA: hypothetical protein VFJ70_00070 [Burkholderiales bacterium]|nr:hypothetical protein [Burkholderiales bacterium]